MGGASHRWRGACVSRQLKQINMPWVVIGIIVAVFLLYKLIGSIFATDQYQEKEQPFSMIKFLREIGWQGQSNHDDLRAAEHPHPEIYPYIVTRLSPSFYHIIILPNVDQERLIQITDSIQSFNDLQTCLVINEQAAIHFKFGKQKLETTIPTGGTLISNKLLTYKGADLLPDIDLYDSMVLDEDIKNDPTYFERMFSLADVIESQDKHPLFGDLTKGGREATKMDLEDLSLSHDLYKSVPRGLNKCSFCGLFRGNCLDPNEKFKGKLMTVNCACENNNRCGYCREPLYTYKLNANYYNEATNEIIHVPGFSALSHDCKKSQYTADFIKTDMERNGELLGLTEFGISKAVQIKSLIPAVWAEAEEAYEENVEAFLIRQERRKNGGRKNKNPA
jgi:hypothetical protein